MQPRAAQAARASQRGGLPRAHHGVGVVLDAAGRREDKLVAAAAAHLRKMGEQGLGFDAKLETP